MGFFRGGSIKTPKTGGEILTALGILLVVVIAALILVLWCFWFRRDKRIKKAAREMILENARIGQRVTEEQARALFELNDSWQKFWECGEREKDSRRLSKRSVQCVEYFRLLKWAKRLRDAEAADDEKFLHQTAKRLASEMEGHAAMFCLKPETKRQLMDVAQLSDRSVTFVNPTRRQSSLMV